MSKKIYVDAGHGSTTNGKYDPGAVYKTRIEADDNLRIASAISAALQKAGFSTKMSRTGKNQTVNRVSDANNWGADAFISCHRNSAAIPGSNPRQIDTSANGWEIYTKEKYTDGDNKLAQAINRHVIAAGVQRVRGGGVKRNTYATLASLKMPAVLAEWGFIGNTTDNQLFDQNLNAYANAVVKALEEIYGTQTALKPPLPPADTAFKAGDAVTITAPYAASAFAKAPSSSMMIGQKRVITRIITDKAAVFPYQLGKIAGDTSSKNTTGFAKSSGIKKA